MSALLFAVLILATWRIASLLAYERGPFDVFGKLRHWVGVRYDVHSELDPRNELARGLSCLWCNSVWVGIVVSLISAMLGWVPWAWLLFLPLALSGGAVLVNRLVEAAE